MQHYQRGLYFLNPYLKLLNPSHEHPTEFKYNVPYKDEWTPIYAMDQVYLLFYLHIIDERL